MDTILTRTEYWLDKFSCSYGLVHVSLWFKIRHSHFWIRSFRSVRPFRHVPCENLKSKTFLIFVSKSTCASFHSYICSIHCHSIVHDIPAISRRQTANTFVYGKDAVDRRKTWSLFQQLIDSSGISKKSISNNLPPRKSKSRKKDQIIIPLLAGRRLI